MNQLLADTTGQLAQILLYHRVVANALVTDLQNGQSISTMQGENIIVTITVNGVIIKNALVNVADIIAENLDARKN